MTEFKKPLQERLKALARPQPNRFTAIFQRLREKARMLRRTR